MFRALYRKFSFLILFLLLTIITALLSNKVDAAIVVTTFTSGPDIVEGQPTPNSYTMNLDSAPTADVVVTFVVTKQGNPALEPNQLSMTPATLTFTPANWNVAQTYTVAAVDDSIIETATNYLVSFFQTSTDGTSDTTSTASNNTNALITVLDNDLKHSMTPSNPTLPEAGGTTTVAIAMNSLTFMAMSQIAITTDDPCMTVSPTTMNFDNTNWNVNQTLTITATPSCDDSIVNPNRKVKISLQAASQDSGLSSFDWSNNLSEYYVNLTDNDTASVLTSATTVNITEGGATGTYTMKLTSQPSANVTATIAGGSNATASPATLTFTHANWNVAHTVTVTAVDNAIVDGTHTQVITNTFTSTDPNYNTQAPQVTATISDNDVIPSADDTDGDGIPNATDPDQDGDGILNIYDSDVDGDGIPNATDTDDDGDGTPDATDTTPTGAGNSTDNDGDGIPNATDPDQDGDGILNIYDNDVDGDGIPNASDNDDDNDGILDAADTAQPNDADGFGTATDVDGDGIPNWNDPDLDGDGILNSVDPDVDGDGIPNTSDKDDDNDGIPNDIENKYANGDANGDGIKDSLQSNVYTGENPVTGAYNTLTLSNTDCKITDGFKVTSEGAQAVQDEKFEYPLGLFGFKVLCGSKGATVNVSVLFDKAYDTSKFSYRKYNTMTKQWLNLSTFVAYSTVTVNSKNVTKAEFTLKDGGTGDEDGVENGIIQDPSGPAKDAALTATGNDMNLMLVGLMTILVGLVVILKPRLMKKN